MKYKTIKIERDDESATENEIKALSPKGYDIVIDATGSSAITQACFKYTKMGSKIVVYGVCDESERISVSPYDIFSKEYKLIGSFAQTHCFDRAISALETGIVNVKGLISHQFSLDEYAEGLETVMSGKQSIKVLINP